MRPVAYIPCFAAWLTLSVGADAAGWRSLPAEAGHGPTLSYDTDTAISYRFACGASDVAVTQTGVTGLLDLRTGTKIGDDQGAAMPDGAALMALFSGKGDPEFMPAQAVKNPTRGWDLTIRLPKDDRRLKALGKAEMLSLFTTGYTMAVTMDAPARSQWNAFLTLCQSAS